MSRQRRHFTPEQKVAILRQHFLDKVPTSDLCEQHGLAVNLFYNWQKQLFENGPAAFTAHDRRRKTATDAKDQQVAALQANLQPKRATLTRTHRGPPKRGPAL